MREVAMDRILFNEPWCTNPEPNVKWVKIDSVSMDFCAFTIIMQNFSFFSPLYPCVRRKNISDRVLLNVPAHVSMQSFCCSPFTYWKIVNLNNISSVVLCTNKKVSESLRYLSYVSYLNSEFLKSLHKGRKLLQYISIQK